MLSPFRRRQQMVRAIQSGAGNALARSLTAAPDEPRADTEAGREYAALRVLLHDDLRKLADVQSIEARNPMKAEMAAQFSDWIEGVLAAGEQGHAAQDEIVVTNMIWAIDYRDFTYALRIAEHVLKFGLVLPERYNRTAACFVAEEIGTIALDSHEAVTLEQLMQTLALTQNADMPDPARAKLHKAIGRAYERRAEAFDPTADNAPAGGKAAFVEEALTHLKRALELYKDIGVKKDIDRVERAQKKLQADAQSASDA
ncbi:MAG: phage terminase small subunit [Pseudomonadota bacterium]|nr:phage terminase small subunit [Pseudomonadota bacterium]MEE2740813.1 phage terminase small subunit [Pseudomonadota bacterium]